MRRDRVIGVRHSDLTILEHLRNGGDELIQMPADIAANCGYAVSTVRSRVVELRKACLIEYHDETRGQYALAELGRRYLEGELTEAEIDKLEAKLSDK